METGAIVYLNGPSSSGKHSIVTALQELMDTPWFNIGIDTWFYNFPGKFIGNRPAASAGFPWGVDTDGWLVRTAPVGLYGQRLMRGLYAATAALATAGNNVVVDDVMYEAWMIPACAQILAALPAYFVGVQCRLEVVQARERARGDRPMGQVRLNYDLVHRYGIYDLEVDTSEESPADCAARIKAHITERSPHAFKLLAAQTSAQPANEVP